MKPELLHTSCRSESSNKSLCLFRQSFCPSEPDPSKEAKEWPSLTSKVFRTPCKTSKDLESKQQHQCAALFPSSETHSQDKFPEVSNWRFSRSAHVTASSATYWQRDDHQTSNHLLPSSVLPLTRRDETYWQREGWFLQDMISVGAPLWISRLSGLSLALKKEV